MEGGHQLGSGMQGYMQFCLDKCKFIGNGSLYFYHTFDICTSYELKGGREQPHDHHFCCIYQGIFLDTG
jgi:hypothetical protein